ncbi:MAG: hypothetical protein ACK50E_03470 [Bacteroidota bacterium]|jgi:hypothetical protein
MTRKTKPQKSMTKNIDKENELPFLCEIVIDEVKEQLNKFSSITEKVIYLDRIIKQTAIDVGLSMWDADCVSCCKQFHTKPAWQGVFDAVHAENNIDKAINADAYSFGRKHYQNYIELKQWKIAVENGQPISTESEFLLIKPLTEQQYQMLLDYVNKHRLFKTPIDLSTMQALFTGKLTQQLQVSNNIKIACFFALLTNDFISKQWQNIINKSKCLQGQRGKPLSNTTLSSALKKVDPSKEYCKEIKNLAYKL